MRFGTLLLCAVPLIAQPPAMPSPEEQSAIISAARQNALSYTKNLPDFLCTQTVTRYIAGGAATTWKMHDKLEMSVAYTAQGERYKLEKVDDRTTIRNLDQVGGFQSHGDFGTMLRNIFRPEVAAEFHWLRLATVQDRPTHVYSFLIPKRRSNYRISWGNVSKHDSIVTGLGGEIFVDAETRQILRVVSEAQEIPRGSPVHRSYGSLEYGYISIAGTQYLLLTRAESNLEIKSGNRRNVSAFTDYRKFTGEASISFDEP